NPMPMFHTAGCVMGALGTLHARATHVPVLAFDPGFVLELLEREGGTAMLGVPTMQIALLEHPDVATRDLSTLRSAVSGGSLVPAELVRRIETTFGVRFCIVYGTTECSPLVTMTRFDDTADDKATTIGRAMPQTEVKIIDPITGKIVAPGAVGERARAAGGVQGPPDVGLRRRVPAHRIGQGPEVRPARAVPRGRADRDAVTRGRRLRGGQAVRRLVPHAHG